MINTTKVSILLSLLLLACCDISAQCNIGIDPIASWSTGSTLAACVGIRVPYRGPSSTGATWSTGNSSIATVDANGGVVGVTTGTTTLSYSDMSGCSVSKAITVIMPVALSITSNSPICEGTPLILTTNFTLVDSPRFERYKFYYVYPNDTWEKGTYASYWPANVNTTTHTVSSPFPTISGTYTVLINGGSPNYVSCATTNVVVNPLPVVDTISGSASLCENDNITLTDVTSSGSWVSSNPSVATVSGGVVYGVVAGNTTISYSVSNACGTTTVTKIITVLSAPTSITGTTTACIGATSALGNTVTGGTWSSAATGTAVVNATTGVVTGVAAGTVSISYSNGCGTPASTAFTVTDVPVVPAITGTASVCVGSTTALANATTGGTWSSSTPAKATVNSSTGVVYGVASGTTTITYSVTNSCGTTYATMPVVVGITAGPISSAATNICRGVATALTTGGASGGTWSIIAPGTTWASIDASTGVITGSTTTITPSHTVTISYSVTNSCGTASATYNMVIKGIPAISYASGPTVCTGETRTLTGIPSDATFGSYAWTSTANASVTSTGYTATVTGVTGSSSPAAVISYTYSDNTNATVCAGTSAATTFHIETSPTYSITGTSALSVGGAGCLPNSNALTVVTGGFYALTPTWTPSSSAIVSQSYTSTSNTITALSAGTQTLTFSAKGGHCVIPTTAVITISVAACKTAPQGTSVAGNTEGDNMHVYPNPNTGTFTLELPASTLAAAITITDISGKIIATKITEKSKIDFDLSPYPRGMYMIVVDAGDKKYNSKIMLE